MKELKFDSIFKEGINYFLSDFSTANEIITLYGQPEDIEAYKDDNKYYHYDNLRFLFQRSELKEVVIYFMNYDHEFYVRSVDDTDLLLNKGIDMLQLILYFNTHQLQWRIEYDESKLDYLIIHLPKKTKTVFYLYESKLDRIILSS